MRGRPSTDAAAVEPAFEPPVADRAARVSPRRVALLAGAALTIVLAPLVAIVAFGLLAPFERAPIPARCTGSVALLPAGRELAVPGVGTGTLLARDGDTAVVVVPSGDRTPAGGTAYIVDTRTPRVVGGVRIASPAVAAAIDEGSVYLFDDKLGNLVRASDGAPLSRFIESDNYRGSWRRTGVAPSRPTPGSGSSAGMAGPSRSGTSSSRPSSTAASSRRGERAAVSPTARRVSGG